MPTAFGDCVYIRNVPCKIRLVPKSAAYPTGSPSKLRLNHFTDDGSTSDGSSSGGSCLDGPESVHSSGKNSVHGFRVRWSTLMGRMLRREIVLPLHHHHLHCHCCVFFRNSPVIVLPPPPPDGEMDGQGWTKEGRVNTLQLPACPNTHARIHTYTHTNTHGTGGHSFCIGTCRH